MVIENKKDASVHFFMSNSRLGRMKDFCEPFNSGQECCILFTHENNKKIQSKVCPRQTFILLF